MSRSIYSKQYRNILVIWQISTFPIHITASWWIWHSCFVWRRNLRSLLHLVQQTNSSRWEACPFWDLWAPLAFFDASLWYLSNTVLHNGTFFPLIITQTLFFHFLAVSLPECFSNKEGVDVPSDRIRVEWNKKKTDNKVSFPRNHLKQLNNTCKGLHPCQCKIFPCQKKNLDISQETILT